MVLNISLRKTIFASIVMIVFWYKIQLKPDIFSHENIFVTLVNEH